LICSFNFLIFLAVCLNISTVINVKILTNSNQQTQSYKFTSHIAAFLSVVLITEMLEICIQTSYDQNVQLILKSYLPVVYGTPLNLLSVLFLIFYIFNFWQNFTHMICRTLRFLCVIKSIWLLHQFRIFKLSLTEKYTDQVPSWSFLSKDNILIPNISDEWQRAPWSLFFHSIKGLY
jgi:hypothetical protein